jgi:hypothetical protein
MIEFDELEADDKNPRSLNRAAKLIMSRITDLIENKETTTDVIGQKSA